MRETMRLQVVENRRSVEAILARREREAARRRMVLAPDFLHGSAQLAECYEVFGRAWAERVLFVVDAEDSLTLAYFDDYFLVVEQWCEGDAEDRRSWLQRRRSRRDRVVRLCRGGRRREDRGEIALNVTEEDLSFWEQGVLGLFREGMEVDASGGDLQRRRVDVLSLVTLTARLCVV